MHRKAKLLGKIKSASDKYVRKEEKVPHLKFGKFLRHPFGSRDSGFRKTFRKVGKVIQREVLPAAMGIGGTLLGGPLMGVAGGALAGTVRGGGNVGRNMMRGALVGLGSGLAVPLAANFLSGGFGGLGGLGGLGGVAKGGSSTLAGLGKALMGGKGGIGQQGEDSEGGLFGGLPSMNALLLGGSLLGNALSRTKGPDPREQRAYEEFMNRPNPMDTLPKIKDSPYMRIPNPNYGREIDSTKTTYYEPAFLDNLPPQARYAQGGYVHGGYIHGESSGVADDVDARIPSGSFVADAETVSSIGDGNTENGRKKLQELNERYDSFEKSGIFPYTERIHVKLSPGEFVISPEAVKGVGNGNSNRGAKKIDKMRKAIRKDKGMKKFNPPKSKPLEYYLR